MTHLCGCLISSLHLAVSLLLIPRFGGLHGNVSAWSVNTKQHVRVSMTNLGSNAFELSLLAENPSDNFYFGKPVEMEIKIGPERPIILSADGADTVDLVLSSTGKKMFRFDELTLPPIASNDYVMKISQVNGDEIAEVTAFEMSVSVGCSDAKKDNLMECFVTCNSWLVGW